MAGFERRRALSKREEEAAWMRPEARRRGLLCDLAVHPKKTKSKVRKRKITKNINLCILGAY